MKLASVTVLTVVGLNLIGCGSEEKVEKAPPAEQQVVMIPTEEFKKGGSSSGTPTPAAPVSSSPSTPAFDTKQPGDR